MPFCSSLCKKVTLSARAEHRSTDIGLGNAAFLCQFYANVFLKDGSRTATLIQPILDTLQMLTDWNASDKEILVASRQLMVEYYTYFKSHGNLPFFSF